MNLQKLDYERHILPLLAIAETIATQGKSPGTSAMNQQAIIRGNRDAEAARQRQYLEDEREAKRSALQEKLYGFQIEEAGEKSAARSMEKVKQEALKKAFEGGETPENQQALALQEYARQYPKEFTEQVMKTLEFAERFKQQQAATMTTQEKLAAEQDKRKQQAESRAEEAQIREEKRKQDAEKAKEGRKQALAKELAKVRASNTNPDELLKTSDEIISLAEQIKSHKGRVYGASIKQLGTIAPGTPQFAYRKDVTRLKDLLTLGNLGKMKGVLSNTDIQILKNAATSISMGLSEEYFLKEIDRIIEKTNLARENAQNLIDRQNLELEGPAPAAQESEWITLEDGTQVRRKAD